MWYAGKMDDGLIAKAKTQKQILAKLNKHSCKYLSKGLYETIFSNSDQKCTVWIMNGEQIANENGFYIDAEYNTWDCE